MSTLLYTNSSHPLDEKMLYNLILKCLERVLQHCQDSSQIRVFEVLLELYKFFKQHPPENLVEGNANSNIKMTTITSRR